MAKEDFDAGRSAGIHEGRRLAAVSRRWTDFALMALIAVAVVVITQMQNNVTDKAAAVADAKAADVAQAAFEGCELRNKITDRQIQFYRENAQIEQGNHFVDELIRSARVDALEGIANDIKALGIRDCSVYLELKR